MQEVGLISKDNPVFDKETYRATLKLFQDKSEEKRAEFLSKRTENLRLDHLKLLDDDGSASGLETGKEESKDDMAREKLSELRDRVEKLRAKYI